MKNKINILLLFLSFTFIACNSKVKKEDNEQTQDNLIGELADSIQSKINSPDYFNKIWQSIPLKTTPVIDTTNFNNINEIRGFIDEEIKILQLNKIYPNLEKEGHNYRFLPSYKLALSDNFYTIILNVFKNDHELETILIIYNSDYKLSQYYNEEGELTTNSLVIAYGEIAEGWSRKFSTIENRTITNIDEFYADKKQLDTTKFYINLDGYIKKIKTKFKSNLRPDEVIVLNKTYTDTITFSAYNDGGDYALLLGEKDEKGVMLFYNMEWETNEKYSFKYGDLIKVNWKMDSIYIVGDGGTLDFKERALDAERILVEGKEVKFLWRTDLFDEELNETFNSIVINEAFVNTITNQEKAALGLVATFIGNECSWDGGVNEDRSNLKCKILTALNLGYQCSDEHYGFLKRWFSKDGIALKELEICRTILEGATVQSTFDEITIFTDKEKKIIKVSYKAHSINLRESKTWSWTQTDTFEYNLESINLINSEKSELIEKTLSDNPDAQTQSSELTGKNINKRNKVNKTNNYIEFTPDTIPNLKLSNFAIEYAYQLDAKKIVAVYDNDANPDTEKDWGNKLLLLNDKNEILFKSYGVGDVYLFEPHFYKNIETNKIIIICQLGFEYYFGGEAFVYENGKITFIGRLDIEGDDHEKSLTDIVEIHEKDNEIVFTFKSDSLVLDPGSNNIVIKNKGVKYVYKNEQLILIK